MFHYLPFRPATIVAIPVIILALAACSGSDGSDDEQPMPTLAPTLDTSAQVTNPPAESSSTLSFDSNPAVQQTPDASNLQLLPTLALTLEPTPVTPGLEGYSDTPGEVSNDVPPFLRDPSPSPTLPPGPTPTPTDITDSAIMAQYGAECPAPGDLLPETVIERYYEFPFTEGDPLVITEYTWENDAYRATEIQCSPDGDTITGETQVIEDENRARIARLVAEMSAPDYTPSEEDFAQPEISPVMENDGETIAVLGSAQKLEPVVESQSVSFGLSREITDLPTGLDAALADYDAYRGQVEQILAELNVPPQSREEVEQIQLCQYIPSDWDTNPAGQCIEVTLSELGEYETRLDPELGDPYIWISSYFTIRGLDEAAAGTLLSALETGGIYTSVADEVNFREDENEALAVENARAIAEEALQPQNQIPGEVVQVRVLYDPPNIRLSDVPPPFRRSESDVPFADASPPGIGAPFQESPFDSGQPICPLSSDPPPEGRQWIFVTTSTGRITSVISRRVLLGVTTFVETTCLDGSDMLYCPDPDAPSSGNVSLELITNADGRPVEAITAIDQPDYTGLANTLSRRRCVDPALYPRIFRSPNYPNDQMLVEVKFAIVHAGDQ